MICLNVCKGIGSSCLCLFVYNIIYINVFDFIIISVGILVWRNGKGDVVAYLHIFGLSVPPLIVGLNRSVAVPPEVYVVGFTLESHFNAVRVVGDRREGIVAVCLCLGIFHTVDQNSIDHKAVIRINIELRLCAVVNNQGVVIPGNVIGAGIQVAAVTTLGSNAVHCGRRACVSNINVQILRCVLCIVNEVKGGVVAPPIEQLVGSFVFIVVHNRAIDRYGIHVAPLKRIAVYRVVSSTFGNLISIFTILIGRIKAEASMSHGHGVRGYGRTGDAQNIGVRAFDL